MSKTRQTVVYNMAQLITSSRLISVL